MKPISIKMEEEFLESIESIMKKHNYMTKTEFIREAIRDKIKLLEGKEIKSEIKSETEKVRSWIG